MSSSTSPTAAERDAPAAPASLPRPSQAKGQGAVKRRMQVVVLDALPEGVWTRIRGPLSGAWYGPWRFHPTDPGSGPGSPEEGDE